MKHVLENQKGLTLVELLGTIAIFGFIASLLTSILFSISTTSKIQSQKVELQQIANGLVTQMEKISNIPDIYEKAGYRGKFVGSWNDEYIVKILKKSSGNNEWVENTNLTNAGENMIGITDINDNLNQKVTFFKATNPKINIKVIQQKNENSQTKTIFSMPNYRDDFAIQTTALILFFKDPIDFMHYYDSQTGLFNLEKIKKIPTVIYFREAIFTYRDHSKVKGEVPGDGQ